MNDLQKLKKILKTNANLERSINFRKFFKNSQNDIFLGVGATIIRKIAKDFYKNIELQNIRELMKSNIHDERSIAHAILCLKFKKGDEKEQTRIFKFYIKNKNLIQDWDGVDDSAPYILGPYLLNRDKDILYKLVYSKRIWDRRIAIITTLYFIRHNNLLDTLSIAEILLQDKEDLIHKAVGWTLREIGKKDILLLKKFLNKYHTKMPRTMLRYSIERFSPSERKNYLIKQRGQKP